MDLINSERTEPSATSMDISFGKRSTTINTTTTLKTAQGVCRQLRCEVCGRKIFGKPNKVIIEKARLTVCTECSKLGKVVWEEAAPAQTIIAKTRIPSSPAQFQIRKASPPKVDTSQELAQNYDVLIRQAREKLGLTHEELGKKLNEKISLLRKIETGKMTPNNTLATKLEHILKIKLIIPAKEEKVPEAKIPKKASKELTLGDIMRKEDKDEKEEDKAGRKRS